MERNDTIKIVAETLFIILAFLYRIIKQPVLTQVENVVTILVVIIVLFLYNVADKITLGIISALLMAAALVLTQINKPTISNMVVGLLIISILWYITVLSNMNTVFVITTIFTTLVIGGAIIYRYMQIQTIRSLFSTMHKRFFTNITPMLISDSQLKTFTSNTDALLDAYVPLLLSKYSIQYLVDTLTNEVNSGDVKSSLYNPYNFMEKQIFGCSWIFNSCVLGKYDNSGGTIPDDLFNSVYKYVTTNFPNIEVVNCGSDAAFPCFTKTEEEYLDNFPQCLWPVPPKSTTTSRVI
jgi:hypothetical protein